MTNRDSEAEESNNIEAEFERVDRNVSGLGQKVKRLSETVEELRQRVEQQQYVIDQLVTDLPTQTASKREKKLAIIKRAVKDSGDRAVEHVIGRDKAAGAAGCSDRHARTLMSELGENHEWAEYDPNGRPAELHIDYQDQAPEAFLERVEDRFPEADS